MNTLHHEMNFEWVEVGIATEVTSGRSGDKCENGAVYYNSTY